MRGKGKFRTRRGREIRPLPDEFVFAVSIKKPVKGSRATIAGYLPPTLNRPKSWVRQLVSKKDAFRFTSQKQAVQYLLAAPVMAGHTFVYSITPSKA